VFLIFFFFLSLKNIQIKKEKQTNKQTKSFIKRNNSTLMEFVNKLLIQKSMETTNIHLNKILFLIKKKTRRKFNIHLLIVSRELLKIFIIF
jgi:hypothetical protein